MKSSISKNNYTNQEQISTPDLFAHTKRFFVFFKTYRDEMGLAFLGVFLFFVASNTQSGWLYFVIALIAGLLFASYVQSVLNLRKLKITRSFAPAAVEDEKINVSLMVQNQSRIPKYLLLMKDIFPALPPDSKNEKLAVTYVEKSGKASVSYKARCHRRGVYKFSKVQVESTGFLGLFYIKRQIEASSHKLVVFPKTYRLDRFILDNVSPYFSKSDKTYSMTGTSYDFMGIREYIPGHETRHIHWPSTAKTNKLMIKEFDDIATHALTVIPDLHEGAEFGFDKENTFEDIIRSAATLLSECKRKGYTFNLFTYSAKGFTAEKNLSVKKGMFRLAEIEPDAETPLEESFYEVKKRLNNLDHVFILKTLPFKDIETLTSLLEERVFITVVFYDPVSYIINKKDQLGTEYEDALKTAETIRQVCIEQMGHLKQRGISAGIYQQGEPLNSVFSFKRSLNVIQTA